MTDAARSLGGGWSARQRSLLGAMGYTLERYSPGIPANQRAALELDAAALQTPLLRGLLAACGLDLEQAHQQPAGPARLRLSWDEPGHPVVLPGMSALRQGAVKRSLWPQLRGLRKAQRSS